MNPYDCPQCGSRNTQSFDNVYSQNVRQSYGVNGRYDSRNQLARQTAPPQNPHVGCGSVLVIFLLTSFSVVLTASVLSVCLKSLKFDSDTRAIIVFWVTVSVGVTTFVGGLLFSSKRVNKQMPAYHRRLAEWNRSMLCRRCGCMWQRED